MVIRSSKRINIWACVSFHPLMGSRNPFKFVMHSIKELREGQIKTEHPLALSDFSEPTVKRLDDAGSIDDAPDLLWAFNY